MKTRILKVSPKHQCDLQIRTPQRAALIPFKKLKLTGRSYRTWVVINLLGLMPMGVSSVSPNMVLSKGRGMGPIIVVDLSSGPYEDDSSMMAVTWHFFIPSFYKRAHKKEKLSKRGGKNCFTMYAI